MIEELIEKVSELQEKGFYGTDWKEENAYQYALKKVMELLGDYKDGLETKD